VHAAGPIRTPEGRTIAPGTPGTIKGFDRACHPQVEFAGTAGLIVVCEERELRVASSLGPLHG
jgi:hypothetical protein